MRMQSGHWYGVESERKAVEWYQEHGYIILAQNFVYHSVGVRGRRGEIDIIALKDDVVHIVEVKARSTCMYGDPIEFITYGKLRLIYRTYQHFLLQCPELRGYNAQIDCVLFRGSSQFDVRLNVATFDTIIR